MGLCPKCGKPKVYELGRAEARCWSCDLPDFEEEDEEEPVVENPMANLNFDENVWLRNFKEARSGIYVRARRPSNGKWESVDIFYLDAPSLLAFLRRDGGNNPIAEDVVGIFCGHGHIVPRGES